MSLCNNVPRPQEIYNGRIGEKANEGRKLVNIFSEHGANIKELGDVNKWYNPRLKNFAACSVWAKVFKILYSIKNKYGVEFLFCTSKVETGKRIIELLGGGENMKNQPS